MNESKLIYVVVPGAGDEEMPMRRDVEIDKDTTPADILMAAGLGTDSYKLELLLDEERETFQVLANNEPVFSLVEDKAKVFVKPAGIVVGI